MTVSQRQQWAAEDRRDRRLSRRRKKRTSIDNTIRVALERAFYNNPKPTSEELQYVSDGLCMEKEVVRVWFCNKRQALKNTIKRLKQPDLGPAATMDPLTDSLEELPK